MIFRSSFIFILCTFLPMRGKCWVALFATILVSSMLCLAEDLAKEVKKAVERSTLNQPGTKPFHLKAALAPSFQRDKDSGRTGDVEIWWDSPTKWKREVRSPEFHQIEIVNGGHDWQKNEGDYFPEWLREIAVELVTPVPPVEQVLDRVRASEVRRMGPMTNISWTSVSGTASVPNIIRSYVALQNSTGLLLYAGGFGWGGEFKEYASFHGRMVPRIVSEGTPEVTAKIGTLEDLGELPPEFFDAEAKGGDPRPLFTEVIDEPTLRKNLLPSDPTVWPPLQDGPLDGNVTTEILVDRQGKVREVGFIVSENSGVNDAGSQAAAAMHFTPFLVNGMPVQVTSQITIPFKTTRALGAEAFDSARTYFERGRKISFPAAGNGASYVLHAEFQANHNGTIEKGRYQDTWLSETQWRREAWFGNSHYVRSRNGETAYQNAEGPDAGLLKLVLKCMEPIPATDTFVESDWRIKRDTVSGVRTIRVLTGYEGPDGTFDQEQVRGFWFDDKGLLLKTYIGGIETQRSQFEDYAGTMVARRIDLLKDGKLGMQLRVTDVSPAGTVSAKSLEVPGHKWVRAFTAEVR
jgi:hypothetical protein